MSIKNNYIYILIKIKISNIMGGRGRSYGRWGKAHMRGGSTGGDGAWHGVRGCGVKAACEGVG